MIEANVSTNHSELLEFISNLEIKCLSFKAGRVCDFLSKWQSLTSDCEILDMITGTTIEFTKVPVQFSIPPQTWFPLSEAKIIDSEIASLLLKGVIVESCKESGDFVSPIFLRAKKDGSYRMILNLKRLNNFVAYRHFKMDTIKTVIALMKPFCYMSSIDLKDAYYSVPISEDYQKYLKFLWKGKYYKFICFPNGLSFCPRKFTKLLKPAHAHLRLLGHVIAGYIDDNYVQGDTFEDAVKSVLDTVHLLSDLGFVIHPKKSHLIPSQIIEHLGFILNSVQMTITLTENKMSKIIDTAKKVLKNKTLSIRDVASLIGFFVSSFPGVMYGPLHYRQLEKNKSEALKLHNNNFDASVTLSSESKAEIEWWIHNLHSCFNVVTHGSPDIIFSSDASKTGWGGEVCGQTCRGLWTSSESQQHINCLELLAALFVLKAFQHFAKGKHVAIKIDNTTAVSVINHMGTSHSVECNKIAHDIWNWCIESNVWLSASFIPGKDNLTADHESRVNVTNHEWMLDPALLARALEVLNVAPQVDLFATRINKQFNCYVALGPEPESIAVDAFSIRWNGINGYIFPPFSLLPRVLQKMEQEEATAVVVIPRWPTQCWYSKAMSLLIDYPVLLKPQSNLLALPNQLNQVHPLRRKLHLLICHLSGKVSKVLEFQSRLQKLSCSHGEWTLRNSITHTLKDGSYSVIFEKLIPFQHL